MNTPEPTSPGQIDQSLAELRTAAARWVQSPLAERIALARQCVQGVYRQAALWHTQACHAKGLTPGTAAAAEDLATGPMATLRYLQLLVSSLDDLDRGQRPRLPRPPWVNQVGRVCVPVLPAPALFDRLLLAGVRADAWLAPGLGLDDLPHCQLDRRHLLDQPPGVALVLGAGNVAGIPATDTLDKLFVRGKVVLLKMNPVNAYLGPIFQRALAPLVDRGLLRIVYGGADVGSYAVSHTAVDEVHITGSEASHRAIVWGTDELDRRRRIAAGRPLLTRPITSELGNVTPWIVVPARYTRRQLAFQAENVAAMIVNNASFNCVAAKMIVTSRRWPQRQEFLDLVDHVLAATPRRQAYYPGAVARFRRFAPRQIVEEFDRTRGDRLPWTLVREVSPDRQPHYFQEESFVCVCAETALDAADLPAFLEAAADLVNQRLWGTLAVGVMIHPASRRELADGPFDQWLARLRYGTVAVNHWPALAYAAMTAPWGGFPGSTIDQPQSGVGWVHNTLLLDKVEKTVLQGPLTQWPKPLWFPSHRTASRLVWRLIDLYHDPRWRRLVPVVMSAVAG